VTADRRRLAALAVAAVALGVVVLLVLRSLGPDGLAPPAPEVTEGVDSGPPLPASTLSVPLRIPLGRLVSILNEAVPRTFGSMEERHAIPDNGRAAVAFALERGDFRARMRDDVAVVEATAAYQLRAFYNPPVLPEISGTCGDDESRPRIRITLEAPISLTEDWALQTESRLTSLEPASGTDRDRCRVTFLDLDLTGRVLDGARSFLEGQEETLDSIAASVDLRSSFEGWWEILRDPIQLEDSVWLALQPRSIRRGPVRGNGDTLEVALALDARPRLVVGPRPAGSDRPLPPLVADDPEPGLELMVEGVAEYATATAFLREEVIGRELEGGGRRVRLDSFELTGLGDGRVAVELGVSGDVYGTLFLVGTPTVDPTDGTISVPDLDFHVATADLLGTAATWLGEIGLRGFLRQRARWPSQPAEAWLGDWLRRGINREIDESLRIRGVVDTVGVRSVLALPLDVRVRIRALATASVEVLPPR